MGAEMSMDCKKTQDNLPLFLTGQLAPEDQANLQLHLQNCPCCSEFKESLAVLDSELSQLPEIEPSPWFEQKIMAQVEPFQTGKPETQWLAWLTPQLALSLVLLLVVGTGSWIILQPKLPKEITHSAISNTEKPIATIQKPAESPTSHNAHPPVTGSNSSTPKSTQAIHEDEIPEADIVLMENLDLLENFDLLAPTQAEAPVSSKPALSQRR
jgi:hypothetical protein